MTPIRQIIIKMILIAFVSITMPGCAYVQPFIQDVNLVSIPQERQIGLQMAAQIRQQMQISTNQAQINRVRSIGRRLVSALPRRDFDYQFYVVHDKSPNAFTIPGGLIFVHTGLLSLTDDNELAGVIAHEIGHAYERHPTKSLTRSYGLNQLAQLFFKGNATPLKTVSLQIAGGGILNKYGRDDEHESDTIGFYLLQKAGMRTDGLLRFLQKLAMFKNENFTPVFFQTHPPTSDRIANLQRLEGKTFSTTR